MNTVFTRRLLVGLTLLTLASPLAALARDNDDNRRHDNNWRNNNSHNWQNKNNNRNNNNWKNSRNHNNNQWQKNHNNNWKNNNNNWKNNHNNWKNNHNQYKQVQKYQQKRYNNAVKAQRTYDRSHWQTNWGNNWNDQREWYHHNALNLQNRQANDRQRQLEAQMRQQYLMYNNNNYNGAYGWNQYSDPRFLDYLHTRQPGLLSSLRSAIGI